MSEDHYCSTHDTVFFMKGKMKGYAHPIKDEAGNTVGWCNEDAQKVAKLPPGESTILPEHQAEIDRAKEAVKPPPSG